MAEDAKQNDAIAGTMNQGELARYWIIPFRGNFSFIEWYIRLADDLIYLDRRTLNR